MTRDEYFRTTFEQTAKESKLFWEEVRTRFTDSYQAGDDKFTLFDIQQIQDDCLDLIMVRSNGDENLDQVENWRLTIERRGVFKNPRIRMHIKSGPLLSEFLNGGRKQPLRGE